MCLGVILADVGMVLPPKVLGEGLGKVPSVREPRREGVPDEGVGIW